jgi:hypothetical protein
MLTTKAGMLLALAALLCLGRAACSSRVPVTVASADIARMLEEDTAAGFDDLQSLPAFVMRLHSQRGHHAKVIPAKP